jgi:hypothetical protein
MNMKRTALTCSLFLAMATAAMAAAPEGPGIRVVPRHIWGVVNGGFTFQYFGPGAYDFDTIGGAVGDLSPLGLVKMHTKHRPTADGSLDGTFEIATAKGDKIQGTYAGTAVFLSYEPPQVLGTVVLEVSHGTGRFAHASGTINATFLEIPLNGNWYVPVPVTWALEGTVSY